MKASKVILEYVMPGLGGTVAVMMYASPMPAVLEVWKHSSIGHLNSFPFASGSANALSWTIYGLVVKDYFVFFPNQIGTLLGLLYTLLTLPYVSKKMALLLTAYLVFIGFLFSTLGLIDVFAIEDQSQSKLVWGIISVMVLIVYYVAPLSTLYKVLKTRSSASLYWPLCLTNGVNGLLWFGYGMAIKDFFIAVPNGFGAILNLFALSLCFFLPRTISNESSSSISEMDGKKFNRSVVDNPHIVLAQSGGGDADIVIGTADQGPI